MKFLRKIVFCMMCLAMLPVSAHPHVWILVEVTPRLNAAGEITALQQRWAFDPIYSAIFIDEMNKTPDEQKEARWQRIEERTLTPLFAEKFYTRPKDKFGEAHSARLYETNGELIIEAELPLLRPVKSLYYQIYEPTYYVEILHNPKQRPMPSCRLNISHAKPDSAKQEEAAALDQDAVVSYDLGQYFAEHAELLCQ